MTKPTKTPLTSVKQSSPVFDTKGNELTPPPLPKIDLHDAESIRREMARVYRDVRNGIIETQDGTRLTYILDMLRKAYETSVLQTRIELIERTNSAKDKKK